MVTFQVKTETSVFNGTKVVLFICVCHYKYFLKTFHGTLQSDRPCRSFYDSHTNFLQLCYRVVIVRKVWLN